MDPVLFRDIAIEEIASERLRAVAELNGLPDAISLMINLPGIELYIPSNGKKMIDRQYIKAHFNGNNTSSIAVHLNMSRSKTERLIKDSTKSDEITEQNILYNRIMRLVCDRCGYEVAERLIKNFSGERIVIPRDGFKVIRRRYVEKNFTGANHQELALLCGVSDRYIRKIVAEMYSSKVQCSLFDPA